MRRLPFILGGVNGDTLDKVNIDFNSGGAKVLDRIVLAYGFSSKIMLAQHFEIAGSSLSNRYRRDTFPADFVVRCMIETGVSLKWLATGEGPMHEHRIEVGTTITVDKKTLSNGKLTDAGTLILDLAFTPLPLKEPMAIVCDGNIYILETQINDLSDGKWLINIEDNSSIRDLALIPSKRIYVTGGSVPFECDLSDIKVLGRVIGIYSETK
ncbi:TPA: phage repressor protein CI [Yersinia enterocolitica]|nr:phage repressor protein CI [Yersinia enterocolitica]HDL7773055.1 phage repressor protein CI [Yersinia enterocolitica]HDL7781643.1 phage repressor protein CI [Yersinia enterocolitica]